MPCRYEETPQEIKEREDAYKRKITQPYIDKLNKLTRLLCWLSGAVGNKGIEFAGDSAEKREFIAWKRQHDAEDAERDRKALREKALAKLTKQERQALGL